MVVDGWRYGFQVMSMDRSTPMRVLMVTREMGHDRRYGLGKSLTPVVSALCAQGVLTDYVCQDDLPDKWQSVRQRWLARVFEWPGLRARADRRLQLSAWTERLWMGFWAARLAQAQGFSHVHLHDPWMGCGFRWAAWWLGLKSVCWGVTEHGFGSYSFATHVDGLHQGPRASRWFRHLEAKTLAAADWVMCPTASAAEQLARDLALPRVPAHWHVVPHARPVVPALSRAQARAALGWSQEGLYVVAVGRLVPLKNMDWVLQACAAWADPCTQLRLCILGEGDHAALREQAAALGMADRLVLQVTDDVMPFLRAADVYMSASSSESFGLANVEALCAGLPCLCTAVGGVPEVMSDGAWLVPCDPQALTRALGSLLDNAHWRAFWQARAEARALACPDADWIAQRYVQIYSPLAGPGLSS
jgi:glycosyltransferase involved in cell wall biosynthesis